MNLWLIGLKNHIAILPYKGFDLQFKFWPARIFSPDMKSHAKVLLYAMVAVLFLTI